MQYELKPSGKPVIPETYLFKCVLLVIYINKEITNVSPYFNME